MGAWIIPALVFTLAIQGRPNSSSGLCLAVGNGEHLGELVRAQAIFLIIEKSFI